MTSYSASVRIRPRADGTHAFDVRYRLDGKSRTMSFTNARDAERWASIVRRVGSEQAITLARAQNTSGAPTLDDWCEQYIRSLSGVEGKTVDHYRLYMRVSISPALGALPIDAISSQRIAEWINGQAVRYAAKTIKNRHGFLSAALQAAVDDGLIARNPCGKSRLPESEQREMVFLTPPEFETLAGYVPERHQPMVRLLVTTGLRFGEVTALRPSDFDWHAGTVRVARAWKSSSARGWYLGAPKTRRSRRTVSLAPVTLPMLRDAVPRGSEWMFTTSRGDPIRQQRFWEDVWAPARRLANGMPAFDTRPRPGMVWDRDPAAVSIDKWPRVHDLRHSHVAWLIEAGIPLPVIQRRLGHESVQTTIDRYGHLTPDMIQQPAAAMDRMIRAISGTALSAVGASN